MNMIENSALLIQQYNHNVFNSTKPLFPSQPIHNRVKHVKHHFPSPRQVFGKPSTSKDVNVFKPRKQIEVPIYEPTLCVFPQTTVRDFALRLNNYVIPSILKIK